MTTEELKFIDYEEFFYQMAGEFTYLPKSPIKDLYENKYVLENYIINKMPYKKEYSIFEFIVHFTPFEYLLDYFCKFPRESIKLYNKNENTRICSDLLYFLVEAYEYIGLPYDDDEKRNEITLKMIIHAYEVWKFPLTVESLALAFDYELYDVVDYILSKDARLLFEKDGYDKDITEIIQFFDDKKKMKLLADYMIKYKESACRAYIENIDKMIAELNEKN